MEQIFCISLVFIMLYGLFVAGGATVRTDPSGMAASCVHSAAGSEQWDDRHNEGERAENRGPDTATHGERLSAPLSSLSYAV